MNKNLIVIVLLAVIGVGGYLITSGQKSPENTIVTPTPTTAQILPMSTAAPELQSSPSAMTSNSQTITLDAGSFYFSVKEIKAKVGDKIKIVMTARDMMHDFNIDELAVDGPIVKSGETTEIEFTASQAGTFEFYCSVGQHRQNGQIGKLIVE